MLAGQAVGNTVMAATVAFLMSDPERVQETLRTLAGDARVRELAADPAFVTAARRMRILPDALARDSTVRSTLADPAFKDALARGDVAGFLTRGDLDGLLQRLSHEVGRSR